MNEEFELSSRQMIKLSTHLHATCDEFSRGIWVFKRHMIIFCTITINVSWFILTCDVY